MRFQWVASAILLGSVLAACSPKEEWVDVGARTKTVFAAKDSGAALSQIPYRLENANFPSGLVKKNIDMLDLMLATQSRRAIGKEAFFGVQRCYSPSVISGLASVRCDLTQGGDLYVTAAEGVLSTLLHLEERSQIGSVVGTVLGEYGSSVVVLVR